MREIKAEVVTAAVRQLCITANKVLPEDLVQCRRSRIRRPRAFSVI